MPYSNSVLQDFVEAPRGVCVNCNKQGQSPRSRHEMARGTGRGLPPSPDGKKMEIRKCLDDF